METKNILYIDNVSKQSDTVVFKNMKIKLTNCVMEALNLLGIEHFDFVILEGPYNIKSNKKCIVNFLEKYKIPFVITPQNSFSRFKLHSRVKFLISKKIQQQ